MANMSNKTAPTEDTTMRQVEDLHPEDTVTRSSNTSVTLTQTVWKAVEASPNKSKRKPMTVVTMNTAESMNEIFPEWVDVAYTGPPSHRKYRPYDLNMPLLLPHRQAYKYRSDSPLTEHGKVISTLIAQGMLRNKLSFQIIYSAPEMVAIQTAQAMSAHFGNIQIRIEPALANWRGFTSDEKAVEYWETPDYYNKLNYPIDISYKPVLPTSKLSPRESPTEYYQRLLNFYTVLVKENQSTRTLVIAHPSTVALTADASWETKADLKNLEKSKEPVSVYGILFGTDAERDILTRPCLPLTPTLEDARERKRREAANSNIPPRPVEQQAESWDEEDDD